VPELTPNATLAHLGIVEARAAPPSRTLRLRLSRHRDLSTRPDDSARQCPACSSASTTRLRIGVFGPCALHRCDACGSEFVHPQPTDERLRRIYGADYYKPWTVESGETVDAIKRATFAPMLEACRITAGSTVLDVGCATGSFLAEAARRGARVYGIDLNPEAINEARERVPQATLHVGVAADQPFPGVDFDAIVMIDFLEHVRDPAAELRTIAAWMKPDSRLVISTPRVDSPLHRALGRHWPQYREEHLTYLSRSGLTTLLGRCGLRVERVTATRKVLTLAYAYGQAVAYPVPVMTQLTSAAYNLVPALRHRPLRVSLGEMTVVAVAR
jgi:2-polyprenyl-3-methyl-5-hydroxy-6-metoxy-1,4-benzoquinol methylase